MPTYFIRNRHKPGERVPKSGIYEIFHYKHRAPHENTLTENAKFPRCKTCGDDVRFELIGATEPSDGAPSVLLVDEESSLSQELRQVLELEGYTVAITGSPTKAVGLLKSKNYDAVIIEM